MFPATASPGIAALTSFGLVPSPCAGTRHFTCRLGLVLSIICAAPGFAFALRVGGGGLLLSLTFSAIAVLLAWQMDQVIVPHLWVTALGVVLIVMAFCLFGVGNRFVERDVASSHYYHSSRPVGEKLSNIGPGCLLTSHAFACILLGGTVLLAQTIVAFF